ncbi:hypothetical protein [Halorussus amylolyticus]|uniref:hypothetical protein n=1 Tax=Halorussus amylolyticus TaxID=1126242 RepID=UPI001043B86B|nr:hypothetical protein [Halorussus amylolyticus]
MDLLKGITEGLQGRGDRDSAGDRDGKPSSRESSSKTESDTKSKSSSTAKSTATESNRRERARDDEHVCDFCGTDFDANLGACPDCGAEIIVRGRR